MATVIDLLPGDVVTQGPQQALFVASEPHPVHRELRLVIWMLDTGTWSLDALRADQEVGDVTPAPREDRWTRLQRVFR
jgi:hypothetical protein